MFLRPDDSILGPSLHSPQPFPERTGSITIEVKAFFRRERVYNN
jgi:hypothetical protein